MTILNADHLFEQSDRLITSTGVGAPRQIDLRRAISSAYYGLFHAVMSAAADEFIGKTQRTRMEYGLVYRRVSHSGLRELCYEVKKQAVAARYKPYEPLGGFGNNLSAFATVVIDLQQRRHSADYDPMIRLKRSDALPAVGTARSALRRFRGAPSRCRRAFLALLLFPPR